MNSSFVNVKVFSLYTSDWSDTKHCYAVNVLKFADEKVSIHSIRLDEIVNVDHRVYTMKLVANDKTSTDLHYYYIKVKTPSGQGINGISTSLRVSEASYKRICKALGIDAGIVDVD